jgi:hypothetical protein
VRVECGRSCNCKCFIRVTFLHMGVGVSLAGTAHKDEAGLAIISRATVDMDDYGGEESRKVGGVQFGGGLRLKF